MSVPVSSLSVAVQGIASFFVGKFGEDVTISAHTPQQASEMAKDGDKHLLNLFTYRITPSGFHADTAFDQPFFIRINTLLTPFLGKVTGADSDVDFRILGHAIRLLHSQPVSPVIVPEAGSSGEGGEASPEISPELHLNYRLQAVLLALSVEELNHIWTTQGGELAYRLSAAYEFSLIPIEPLKHRDPAVAVTTSIFDVQPNLVGGDADGIISFGADAAVNPIGGIGDDNPPPPTNWLPVVLISKDNSLTNEATITNGTPRIEFALAGPAGERVALEVFWVRANSSTDTQEPQVFTIETSSIADKKAIKELELKKDSVAGDVATVLTRPVDAAGQPLSASPYANRLSLNVQAQDEHNF